MARLAWIASEVGSATGFPKENNDTAEAPIRPGSGMMVMMVGNDGWTLRPSVLPILDFGRDEEPFADRPVADRQVCGGSLRPH
jgi:hypothetical protein